ncbi:hypothetical protein [Pedobacter aquatilis]|uniref:hypothetical protein n=1 Tax=Pedobacter aquatilis TaxID=351343 RepID=UPI00292EB3F6|nr:hypothetical protein [Pedobacter aquatilis]
MKNTNNFYLALSISFLIFLVSRIFIIFSNGTDLAGIEQNVIYSIQIYLASGKLYFSPKNIPFSITQYTPLYYYICAFTAKIFAINPDGNFNSIYVIGRVWNLVFNLSSAYVTYSLARRFFKLSKDNCWIIFLSTFTFTFAHNFAVRPDSLHDLIGITSIYTFLLMLENINKLKGYFYLLVITIILSLFAVLSKQSGIQFIIIFLGITIWNKKWILFIRMLFCAVLIYAFSIYLFTCLYPSFLENVVGGVNNGINIENYLRYVIGKNIFIITVWPLILGFLYIILRNRNRFTADLADTSLIICTLGTLIFALVTALKMGSTAQYFIVFINLSLIVIFKEIENKNNQKRNTIPIIFKSYLGVIAVVFFVSNAKLIYKLDGDPILEAQRASANRTASFLKDQNRLSANKYIFFNLTTDYTIPSRQSLNNIFFRNCLVPQMDILQYSTKQLDVIGYQKLEEMIKNGDVNYIVGSDPKINFLLFDNLDILLKKHYRLIKNIDGYLIYEFLPLNR